MADSINLNNDIGNLVDVKLIVTPKTEPLRKEILDIKIKQAELEARIVALGG